jgi:hypothetical protein
MMVLAGCNKLKDYNGEFDGPVLAYEPIRIGFPPETTLHMKMDFYDEVQAEGTMSTSDGTFDNATLQPIQGLSNDGLWTLKFSGSGFLNYMRIAEVTNGVFKGKYAVVIISLFESGDVEVRIIVGASDLYGVFTLKKQGNKTDEQS